MIRLALILAVLAAVGARAQVPCSGAASFKATWSNAWTVENFPTEWPANAHLSPMLWAVHNSTYRMWASSSVASEGGVVLAETGATTTLADEIEAAGQTAMVGSQFTADDITNGVTSKSVTFSVPGGDVTHVSFMSMLAPSPDWFTGWDSFDLCDQGDGNYFAMSELFLMVYDAGSDDGATYTAANDPTDPRAVVRQLNTGIFGQNSGRVGTMMIQLSAGARASSAALVTVAAVLVGAIGQLAGVF